MFGLISEKTEMSRYAVRRNGMPSAGSCPSAPRIRPMAAMRAGRGRPSSRISAMQRRRSAECASGQDAGSSPEKGLSCVTKRSGRGSCIRSSTVFSQLAEQQRSMPPFQGLIERGYSRQTVESTSSPQVRCSEQ